MNNGNPRKNATVLLAVGVAVAQAQTQEATAVDLYFWENIFGNLVIAGGVIIVVAALVTILRLLTIIVKIEELKVLKEKGVEEVLETNLHPQETWWQKFLKIATKAVPVAREQDIDLGHEYDGIRELDNKLPPWWLWLFYASIIFSAIYWAVFHMSSAGPGLKESYEKDMEIARASVSAYLAKQADQVDETNVVALTASQDLELGKTIFGANCVPCHGEVGEGNSIGPNLTDEHWIHGGGIKNVFTTIKYGVVDKGMQSWRENLRAADMQRVASFILTLQNSNPPGAKAPQGEIWKPEEQGEESSAVQAVDGTGQRVGTAGK
jgi:cytochrome c oxidase cbb3-type subunit 3